MLVDLNTDAAPRYAGDGVNASISARYLFGAPMAGARVRWIVQHRPMNMWELDIPNAAEWEIGGYDSEDYYNEQPMRVATERFDSVDARGTLDINVEMPVPEGGRRARTWLCQSFPPGSQRQFLSLPPVWA